MQGTNGPPPLKKMLKAAGLMLVVSFLLLMTLPHYNAGVMWMYVSSFIVFKLLIDANYR